jgi:type I restriction enzyme R subunit
MNHRGAETDFELTTIDRLELLDYNYEPGADVQRDSRDVVLEDRLLNFLREKYSDLPEESLRLALTRFIRPQGVDSLRRNLDFHRNLVKGIEVSVETEVGSRFRHVYAVDWEHPEANDFLVVNQLPVTGQNDRRPDIVIFVNGLPLVLFELKNPWEPNFTVENAFNQIQHYKNDIPQIFEFNSLTVISDGVTTLHGQWTAPMEWFAPWKSIDGETVEANTTGSMKTLLEGLFAKHRLLSYVRDFIVFEEANDRIEKKGAKYHQFFAVRIAVERARMAFSGESDQRLGVIWHTTGAGKSLSMLFLIGILRRLPELSNPTVIVQVDATDLDQQLFDQFVAGRSLVGEAIHAELIDDLRRALRSEGGELVFSTLQKFQLREGETKHPSLSKRENVIVVADEAHRSQYGFLQGYARYMRDALPNAKFIGFTGTPVNRDDADTISVFGELIHVYDIRQSQLDHATVPIYYDARQVKLHLSGKDIDAALAELSQSTEPEILERRKSRWAALAAAAGAKDRVNRLAAHLLDHYLDRRQDLAGKAMAVCMTRANCVRLFDALQALPGCPETKVIMTGNLGEDPEEWSRDGHITTKKQRDATKQRMVDPDDPLSIVIVCDMWLTGTDIPCLHTLYIDKPMRGHSIIQAISRVNRVFRDKPAGLVVDYIGIADQLREATNSYSASGGRGDPAPGVEGVARPLFLESISGILDTLPPNVEYAQWRELSRIDLEDRFALVYGYLTESEERRAAYLAAEAKVSHTFVLVKQLDDCRSYADAVIFFQQVRKQLLKTIPGSTGETDFDHAVKDLVDETIAADNVVDVFTVAGIPKPDISILDENFLQTFKDRPHQNLQVALLDKLLTDQLLQHEKRNLVSARSFRDMLEKTLQGYHNRLIDAAVVIQEMVAIRPQLDLEAGRAEALGVSEEELAFYDALASSSDAVYDDELLKALVHEIVQTIRKNLRVDWTAPWRDDVRASVRNAVKRVLRDNGIKTHDFDKYLDVVMNQATVTFAQWPLAA